MSTRFHSYDQLRSVIEITYRRGVQLTHCDNGREVVSVLKPGVSQDDFTAARDGTFRDRLALILKSPYAAAHRRDLQSIYALSRRRSSLIPQGTPAFYDLSQAVMAHISAQDLPAVDHRDLTSEKGYFNTINHITAQSFMTSIFSERMAALIADAHERMTMPALITGTFSQEQIADLENGPVDNYVDMINNEWGQELGKRLKERYGISRQTRWTTVLLADYLNDLQHYYSWAFSVGFMPFRPSDEIVVKFTDKLNRVVYARFT
ncbi:MAG: hypothetical protein R3301_15240 [Saprospiraceae bacterium]|nr:hypothetical protein [Saprospiraceae bacterium]